MEIDKKKKVVALTELQTDFLRRVADGEIGLSVLLWHLAQYRRLEEGCKYLIKTGMTGKNLLHFWLIQNDKSVLSVINFITTGLEKQSRVLFIDRDLRKF